MSVTRRRLLGSVCIIALLNIPALARPFHGGAASGSPPPTPGLPTTMTLVNTSGSTQAADFITPVFGHAFRKGDVPAKAVFTGSISGTTLTTSAPTGTIGIGDLVFSANSSVAPWTYITAGSGSTWTVSVSQTVSSMTMWSAGTPKFTISGTAQALTWGCQNFWSDHSLKHASFAFRCGSSIAGNGTLSITVDAGGTTPATSARTLTDVYNQLIQVNAVGKVGLSGTWTGVVASNALNVKQSVYMDGDTGKYWRIDTHMGQSGSPHGQFECSHYVMAMTASGGGLAGFRYVPRPCQPWYDVNSPALAPIAATMTWQHGAGPTTVSWTFPFNPVNFTTINGALCTVAGGGTHNYYQGTLEGGLNMVPGVFTVTGGALDTAISANTLYWVTNKNAANSPPNNTDFYVCPIPCSPVNSLTMNGDATGTMTFTPTPHILPMQSFFDLDTNGYAKFFQGTGSFASDCTVMTQFSCAYLVSTGLIQPFDTSFTGTAFGGTIADNAPGVAAFPMGWNYYSWNPCSVGPIGFSAQGSPGEQDYLGPLMQYTARHFYNQTRNSEILMRVAATASDFYGVSSFRDSVSGNYINLSNSTYTGVVAPSSGLYATVMAAAGNLLLPAGVTGPPANTNLFTVKGDENSHSHQPNMAFWAGLIFADPHFVDLAVESGIGSLTMFGRAIRNATAPDRVAAVGVVVSNNNGGLREITWALREIVHGAIVAPNTHPDGSQSCDMLRDHANRNFDYLAAMCNSTQLGGYFNTNGRWSDYAVNASQGSPSFDPSSGGFMAGYFLNIVPLGVSALENANALTFLNFSSGWWNHVMNTFGGYWMYGEYDFAVFLSDATGDAPIPSDTYYGVQMPFVGCTLISWTSGGSPHFSVTGTGNGWPGPVNGDLILFGSDALQTPPGNFSVNTPYYVRDQSGLTFNLAASPGGTAIVPSNSGSLIPGNGLGEGFSGPFTMSVLPSWGLATTGNVANANQGAYFSYCVTKGSGFKFCKAVGATGYDVVGSTGYSLITDAATRIANGSPTDFTQGPTYLTKEALN